MIPYDHSYMAGVIYDFFGKSPFLISDQVSEANIAIKLTEYIASRVYVEIDHPVDVPKRRKKK